MQDTTLSKCSSRLELYKVHNPDTSNPGPSEIQTLAEKATAFEGYPDKKDTNKYCAFHGTHGHDTANYRSWKMHLKELVAKKASNRLRTTMLLMNLHKES